MIELECSNCGRMQQLEEAFAGCICRCRFCQAIQTVPGSAPGAGGARLFGRPAPQLLHCPDDQRVVASQARWWLFVAISLLAVAAVAAGAILMLVGPP